MTLWAKKVSWFCQNCILLFRGAFEQNSSPLLFLARFFKHGLPKLYSTCPEALFAEFYSQNHISWHCERKYSAGFVRTAIYFSGELLSKTNLKVVDLVFFVVLARFFKHGLPKLYSTCPEAFFADFFSQNHINWHCERKNSAGFCQNCFLLFRGTFEQNSSPLLFLATFFKHGLPNLYSTCPEEIFAEFYSQNHISWHCERKYSAGFVRTAIYFSGELLSKTNLKVVDLVFFVVLARFFKHGLPKLYSTCPEAFFADFFSQNHINWHCERKNSAGFVRTAFYFSEELSSKTVLLYYSLPHSSSMGCQTCILRVQRKFLRNFIHRIILVGTVSEKIQLVLSERHSTFPGNFWAKQFSKSSIWFFW